MVTVVPINLVTIPVPSPYCLLNTCVVTYYYFFSFAILGRTDLLTHWIAQNQVNQENRTFFKNNLVIRSKLSRMVLDEGETLVNYPHRIND